MSPSALLASASALLSTGPAGEGGPTAFLALSALALVQGLTEFLPVSSSGHLVLAQSFLGLAEPGLAIDVALHVGTLAAVVLVYRRALRSLLAEALAGRPRELLLIATASVPTALLGLLLKDRFEAAFTDPRQAARGLLVTAGLLAVGDLVRRRRLRAGSGRPPGAGLDDAPRFGFGAALVIGVAQGVAIWPGISRSGATIATGLVLGLAPAEAARFSFLASIPAILGAASLQLLGDGVPEGGPSGLALVWAALLAGLVGWGALRGLLALLGRGAFAWFAAYCGALGALYLALA